MVYEKARARFLRKSTPQENGCIYWVGCINEDGYGLVRISGVTVSAHRAAWVMAFGDIPEGMCVCHKCDVPKCVNPDHLFLGTHAVNMRDKVKKGRMVITHAFLTAAKRNKKGENNPRAKLSNGDVEEIRGSLLPVDELASRFSVTSQNINAILSRKTWVK